MGANRPGPSSNSTDTGLPAAPPTNRHTRRLGMVVALLAAAANLGVACTPVTDRGYQASASVTQHHLDVHFLPGRDDLRPGEAHRLATFLSRHGHGQGRGQGLRIAVDATDDRRLDDRRHQQIAALLDGSGLDVARTRSIQADRPTGPAGRRDPATATVILAQYRALAPDCTPPAEGVGRLSVDGRFPLGCASAVNLANHVHHAQDLAIGREMGPASGERAVRAIQRYRAGADGTAGLPLTPSGASGNVQGP